MIKVKKNYKLFKNFKLFRRYKKIENIHKKYFFYIISQFKHLIYKTL